MAGTRLIKEKGIGNEVRRITKSEIPAELKVYTGVPVATQVATKQDSSDKSEELERVKADLKREMLLRQQADAKSASMEALVETLRQEAAAKDKEINEHAGKLHEAQVRLEKAEAKLPEAIWIDSVDKAKLTDQNLRILCKVSKTENKSEQSVMTLHITTADLAKLQKYGAPVDDKTNGD